MTDTAASVPFEDGQSFPSVDSALFRAGMARLPAAITIVTTVFQGERYGFTASAVSSVTDAPPTLLVCVNRSSQSHRALLASHALCVNVVPHSAVQLALNFAGANGLKDMAVRFGGCTWETLVTGAPVLAGAVVSFDCRLTEHKPVGTHDVLFCRVVGVRIGGGEAPLIYHDRDFRIVARP